MKDRILSKASHANSKSFTQDHFHSQQDTKDHEPLPAGEFLTPDAQLFARSLKLKLSYIDPKLL
jgi:ethanolamine utilization cobalamin adenosyltransferase